MYYHIIASYLLSILGVIIYYYYFRKQLTVSRQKLTLWLIIAFSLCLPPLVDYLFVPQSASLHLPHEHQIVETAYLDYCPDESELEVCYKKAQAEEDFCECRPLVMENILVYQSNPIYDFFISHQNVLYKTGYLSIICIILFLAFKIGFLIKIIWNSEQETLKMGGKSYTILYPKTELAVGSFQLWKAYIIWQKEMFELNEEEKNAILWHEISHLQQKDTWFKILLNITQTIWCLNPAYYFLVKELDRISEYIADEFAIQQSGNKKLYVNLLVKMKRLQNKNLALTHRFRTKEQSQLKARVHRLLGIDHANPRRVSLWKNVLIGSFFLGCFVLTSSCTIDFLRTQADKFTLYETLSEENRVSGKPMFCKNCLMKKASLQ